MWLKDKSMTSHFESYALAIQQQEIGTKDLLYRRAVRHNQPNGGNKMSNKCRLCKIKVEDIAHIISGCPKMSARYYLPFRHDIVAKNMLNSIRKINNPNIKKPNLQYPNETIINEGDHEYWWNISVKSTTNIPHNKPDLIIWKKKSNICDIVEFSCPADVNVSSKVIEKENIYGPLMRNLQLIYPAYKYNFIPIIIGALGTIPKELCSNIEKLGYNNKHALMLIRKLQVLSISGSVKICKTFMKFTP